MHEREGFAAGLNYRTGSFDGVFITLLLQELNNATLILDIAKKVSVLALNIPDWLLRSR
jgi:hypothetical protein